ncbi:MAG: mechanosensitive ion channel domain-containing protein [Sulfurimonas sp.]|jgi:small-conductance mechanosensitive channel
MRFFIFILFLTTLAFSADINEKLFEGTDKEVYYKEIQKQIESTLHKRAPELLADERLQLSRVRSAASQNIQIDSYDLTKISGDSVNLQNYYDAINAVASLRYTLKEHQKMLSNIQAKLAFIKEKIVNIIEVDKEKLLSLQLQFAYNKLLQKNIESKIELLQKHEQEILKQLLGALVLLQCDKLTNASATLLSYNEKLQEISQEKIALQISLENATIAESDTKEKIILKAKAAEDEYQKTLAQIISLKTKQSICLIENENNQDYFKLLIEIEELTLQLSPEIRPIYNEQVTTLRDLSKEAFGVTKLFFGATLHEVKEIFKTIKEYITSPIFVFNEHPISFLSLIKALTFIIFGFITGMFYKKWITNTAKRWPNASQMSVRLATNMGYYFIVILAFIISISSIGIDMSSMSLIAGALSIGIGFGLQTVVSNFIAGVILMFERTIRIGDVIELNATSRGRVTDMRIRSTTIKTFDNIDIVVPNSSFIQNNVINWTLEDMSRRVHIPFSVAYGTNIEFLIDAILGELQTSDLAYIKDNNEKEPEIWMVEMAQSTVNFELLVWVEGNNKDRPNAVKSDFLVLIYNALYKHNISIPFPQMDVHIKEAPSNN